MKGRHDLIGVMVLETMAKTSDGSSVIFSEDHLTLAMALAHQGALAVEETRYYLAMLNAGQLAAVGHAMASLSHDIKNIMHGVKFGSDLVRQGFADDDRELLRKGWRLVERNQERIDTLIQNMLGYSKPREPLREATHLKRLIDDAIKTVQGKALEFQIEIAVIIDDPESRGPMVSCDPDGILRAVLNILVNAIDAIGSIDERDPGRIEIRISLSATENRITISDNGPGISSSDHDQIFEPFVSFKGHRGTGLGLPVSRKILREHGGDLTLEPSTPGSRFVLSWPNI
jgi:signal transduction histidine kinase